MAMFWMRIVDVGVVDVVSSSASEDVDAKQHQGLNIVCGARHAWLLGDREIT